MLSLVALAWWRLRDGVELVGVLSFALSFWASGAIERRLPRSVSQGGYSGVDLLEFDFEEPFIYKKNG